MTINRSLLAQAFPDNPRLRAEIEAALKLVDSINSEATELQSRLDAISAELATGEFQPLSSLLSAIAVASPSLNGAIEIVAPDTINVRGIDTADDACLVSRPYLMSYVGKGTTGARPTLSAHRRAVYFDTTLAANGKPIFWNGTGWVDATGATV